MGRVCRLHRSSHKPVADSAQLTRSVLAPRRLHDRDRMSRMPACLPACLRQRRELASGGNVSGVP